MKEIEKQDSYSYEKDDDEDMLFGNCETHIYNNNHDDQHDEYEDENEMLCEKNHSKTKSFWGKPIIKKGNHTLPNGYTMDMFVKSSKR